jgi:hypothetical protein
VRKVKSHRRKISFKKKFFPFGCASAPKPPRSLFLLFEQTHTNTPPWARIDLRKNLPPVARSAVHRNSDPGAINFFDLESTEPASKLGSNSGLWVNVIYHHVAAITMWPAHQNLRCQKSELLKHKQLY